MQQLVLTPSPFRYEIGEDDLANKCQEMLIRCKKVGISLIPTRSNFDEVTLYSVDREQSCKLCQDSIGSDPYLVDAWIIFEELNELDKDYLYQQMQELSIFDDYNYDFSDGDYDE